MTAFIQKCPECGEMPVKSRDRNGRPVYTHCGLTSYGRGIPLADDATIEARSKAERAMAEYKKAFPSFSLLAFSRRLGLMQRELQISRAPKELCETIIDVLEKRAQRDGELTAAIDG